jgi:hypothetical protein
VTEKDWIKIKDLPLEKEHFRVLVLQTHFLNSLEEFYASLDRVVGKAH